jgi:hypothetical protein
MLLLLLLLMWMCLLGAHPYKSGGAWVNSLLKGLACSHH